MEDKFLLKEVRDRFASQGWSNAWCESCGAIAIHCPECGTNVCGTFTKDCGTCPVAFKQQEKIWAETDPIIERMTDAAAKRPPSKIKGRDLPSRKSK